MTPKTVAIVAALLAVALVALAGPTRAEERVLHCADTDATGFIWRAGQTGVERSRFPPDNYIVNVLSEERRMITRTTGDVVGMTGFTCRKVFKHLACNDSIGATSWLFQGNNFVRAYIFGPQFAGDQNIWISYGTCTELLWEE